ncbi:ral guanine nucleotide dissociation stimulator-like [Felis catus]|uniref:ral guanine nucleotide dissociation stimulator-like n=1 Tax=Felis catus TaxID=9685 RepID=UPI001D1A2319|nr:ral guanine nucleotide dissociation stimulator-like [Felis catus]
MRYGCFHSEAEEDGGPREQEKRAISSILGTWMDHYPEEFFRPPDFTSLKLRRAYVRVHMPGSELQRRARLLYSWRKHREPNEPESLGEEDSGWEMWMCGRNGVCHREHVS